MRARRAGTVRAAAVTAAGGSHGAAKSFARGGGAREESPAAAGAAAGRLRGLREDWEDGGMRAAVLVSGGVDSSVALQRLVDAGNRCTAFYLKIWFQEHFDNFWGECPWEEDLSYVRAVCERLRVPLEVVPLTDAYWDKVVQATIEEYRRGRTPNPDIMCNSRVKFGAFYEHIGGAVGAGAGAFDVVASGHYARALPTASLIGAGAGGEFSLCCAPDAVKDQTYFLSGLTQAQVRSARFPIGSLTKPEVRALAGRAGLPNGQRRDSQGICFLGKVPFGEFVKSHLGTLEGDIVEFETGARLGAHEGFWFHTVGQRKGLGLSGGPWYVVGKDVERNLVYVSNSIGSTAGRPRPGDGGDPETFECDALNWISGRAPAALLAGPRAGAARLECHVKVRHGPEMYRCSVSPLVRGAGAEPDALSVTLCARAQGIAGGQFAVFYDGGGCLGSGVIRDRDASDWFTARTAAAP